MLNYYKALFNSLLSVLLLIVLGSLILLISCEPESKYERRLEAELSKNIRVDSLFLGYYLGMSREAFYAHSWDLNSKEIVTGQQTVNYKTTELESPATMEFYPQFKNEEIFQMPVEIHYDGWAPWNRHLFADTLITDMVELYEEKYDADFFKSVHPESQKEAYIDIQGNRRISIFKRDDRIVFIEFLDLSAVKNEN